jgi:2-isopropylmalate synthase
MAKDQGLIVQFSPEGYSKVGSNFDFCTELLIAAAENGTTYFNMPDTIG